MVEMCTFFFFFLNVAVIVYFFGEMIRTQKMKVVPISGYSSTDCEDIIDNCKFIHTNMCVKRLIIMIYRPYESCSDEHLRQLILIISDSDMSNRSRGRSCLHILIDGCVSLVLAKSINAKSNCL